MKKRNQFLAGLLALALCLSLVPTASAAGTVTPTPPDWIPEEYYLVFPDDEVYEPENWAKVLEMREDAANGALEPNQDIVQSFNKSSGIYYELALIWLQCAENARNIGDQKGCNSAFWQSYNYFQRAGSHRGEILGIKDNLYYQLELWQTRTDYLSTGNVWGIEALHVALLRLNLTIDDFFNAPYMDWRSEEERANVCEKITKFRSGIAIYLDGKRIIFDDSDGQPEFLNDRTMIPIRMISELLGADVTWRQETNEAVLVRAGVTIVLPIGGSTAYVNGQSMELDAPSYVSNERTMVPLRFVSEAFGQSVIWNEDDRGAYITEDKTVAGDSNLEAWAIPMGAMLSYLNTSWVINSDAHIRFGDYSRAGIPNICEKCRDFLLGWGIKNRDDLILTVCSMTYNGHNSSFLENVAYINTLTDEEFESFANAAPINTYMAPYTKQLGEKWGDRGIMCWDLFRMSNLVQWGYTAGYLTYAEALALLEPAATLLCENFSSWDEAYENYLDGYNWWARNNVLDQDIWETERGILYLEDLRGSTCKWRFAFDETLFLTGVIPVPGVTAEQLLAQALGR